MFSSRSHGIHLLSWQRGFIISISFQSGDISPATRLSVCDDVMAGNRVSDFTLVNVHFPPHTISEEPFLLSGHPGMSYYHDNR